MFNAEAVVGPLTSEQTEELLKSCMANLTLVRVIDILVDVYDEDDQVEIADRLEDNVNGT